jgi:hypothetical protein
MGGGDISATMLVGLRSTRLGTIAQDTDSQRDG